MNRTTNVITKESVQRIYPLRPMQKGMLFHSLHDSEKAFYFEQIRYRLRGNLDVALCEQVWNELMRRHELLRSVFVSQKVSQPVQIVLKHRQVDFTYKDLRYLSDEECQSYIDDTLFHERQRGFDLSRDALVRIYIFQCDDHTYEMVWNYPHILLDGWSGSILQSEFIELYEAYCTGRAPDLNPPADYNDYLDWCENNDRQEDLRYWQHLLQGYDFVATVPQWNKQNHGQSYEPSEYSFRFDHDTTEALLRLARRLQCTLNVLLQTMWGVILGRYNQSSDVVFGVVVSGRPPEVTGIDRMVGLFINTLPLRVRVESNSTFNELIQEIQEQSLANQEHDSLSLAEIQNEIQTTDTLLDHLFVFENYPMDQRLGERVNLSTVGFEVESTEMFEQVNYPFGMMVLPGEELQISFRYDEQVHTYEQMRWMEGHWRALTAQILEDPEFTVQELTILSETENRKVLYEFQGKFVDYPRYKTLVDLWEEQVAKTPQNIALRMDRKALTYVELDQLANGVAHNLRIHHGIKPEKRIGVLLPRGFDFMISLLGILKAGGVYVPMDPNYPSERIQFIVEDAQCEVLLVTEDSDLNLTDTNVSQVVPIRTLMKKVKAIPELSLSSDNLAYMIYTSGSTGQPKGVMLEHRGFINMIQEQICAFGVSEKDRVLQFASCSFDASLSEIFMALLSGACLVLVEEELIRDANRMSSFMDEEGITVVTFPPSYLRAMEKRDFPSLRVMITAGESLHEEDAIYYAARLRYFNAYGPTETSVCATYVELDPANLQHQPASIGHPIANTQILILDSSLQPVPLGVVGEICIAGEGVARGYWNRPDENEKKFIEHPFIHEGKLYCTGDLGRWLENGCIEFLGRKDSQVKLHGYRIELGEIEKQIQRVSEIQQAVVRIIEREGEKKELIAYYVASREIQKNDLYAVLRKSLPAYMIPSDFISLGEFPLTPNLKIDYKRLPDPRESVRQLKEVTAPRNSSEAEMVQIWEQVLSRKPIGIHDSFFDHGGHSLLAIQLVGQMGKSGFSIPLKTLYEYPTIAQLAEHLNAITEKQYDSIVHGRFKLTPIQRWFFQSRRHGHHHFNHYALLEANNEIDVEVLQRALKKLWLHHDGLRSRFDFCNDDVDQIIEDDTFSMPFDVVDLRKHSDAWPYMINRIEEEQTSLCLETGPLCRHILFRLSEGDYFFWLIHHLITDAISWNILFEDLEEAYHQSFSGIPISLPPKTSSYQQWAEALNQYAVHENVLQEKPFWQRIEETYVSPLPLSNLNPDPINVYGDSHTLTCSFPLEKINETFYESPASYILSAIGYSLYEWSGNQMYRVLMTHHGRDSPWTSLQVHRTVGWFTVYYPLLLNLYPSKRKDELYQKIRDWMNQVPHCGIGYGILRYLSPMEDTNNMEWSSPSILFNYMGEIFSKRREGLFVLCEEHSGASLSPIMERPFLLEIDAMIRDNHIDIHLSYNQQIHSNDSIQKIKWGIKKHLPY